MRALIQRIRDRLTPFATLSQLLTNEKLARLGLEHQLGKAKRIAEDRKEMLDIVSASRDYWRRLAFVRCGDKSLLDAIVDQGPIVDQLAESIAWNEHAKQAWAIRGTGGEPLSWADFWTVWQVQAHKQAREILATPPIDLIVAEWSLSQSKNGPDPSRRNLDSGSDPCVH